MDTPDSPLRRQILRDALAGASALTLLPIADAFASSTGGDGIRLPTGDVHDFDIFVGRWRTQQRRLKERLVGSTEWIEFEGVQDFRLLLGGAGNMTDNLFQLPDGPYRGVTVRAFDPKTKSWAIWWLDGNRPHKIDVPVIGRFENGSGAFYADDKFDGKPIKVRFLWKDIKADSRRWEQAFSPDGGKTWETNWTGDFFRIAQ